jgi:hypothetical protein
LCEYLARVISFLLICHLRFWDASGTRLYDVSNGWTSEIEVLKESKRLHPITFTTRLMLTLTLIVVEVTFFSSFTALRLNDHYLKKK